MKMPYEDLISGRLQSLVTLIKMLTVMGYFGLFLSAIGLINMFFSFFNLYFFSYQLFFGSIAVLVSSGVLALLVSVEESYRQKVLLAVEPIKE